MAVVTAVNSSIADVEVVDLSVIDHPDGDVLHMLKSNSPLFSGFGEIYFSEIKPGCIKAWKRHFKMTQLFAVPVGKIELKIYDNRLNSVTIDTLQSYTLGRPDHYQLIKIPPLLYYGFRCISECPALIANCTSMSHDPKESEKVHYRSEELPDVW